MPTTECAKEQTTQHYRKGEGHGFGSVQPDEAVLLAIFAQTPQAHGRIATKAVRRQQLIRGEFSLLRRFYISREEFEHQFVGKEAPVGVAIAITRSLRELSYHIEVNNQRRDGRTVCVLDTVHEGDHDAHAALEYNEGLEAAFDGVSAKLKGILRGQLDEDIAEAFNPIVPVASVFD